jgi:predicted nuclease of restriction endonuclease-like (RecB) superfamily
MSDKLLQNQDYKNWLKALKQKVRQAQLKTAVQVNTALLEFYWWLGADIVERQKTAKWGSGFLQQLSQDLMAEFPEMKGFSFSNLKYVRQWYLFYEEAVVNSGTSCSTISQQAVGQLADGSLRQQVVAGLLQIPWGHNVAIISKCADVEEALFYVNRTLEHNWSRAVLVHQLEIGLYQRKGMAVTNFTATLPAPQSDLAQQLIKDPYCFDFLSLTESHNERELEKALTEHITKFLLELGVGFAFIGRQRPLLVGERDFFLDLLFYHTRLHCYVVIELKTNEFEPEYAGKLNFYLKAVDEQIKTERDEPSIGILLCKSRDKLVVEYALSDIHKPMGVAEYQLTHALPDNLKANLPSIEKLEAEFSGDEKGSKEPT